MGNKLAIMYSGGLDSLIAYNYAKIEEKFNEKDISCVWIDMGQDYAAKEKEAINNLHNQYPEYAPEVIEINMKELVPAVSERLSNQIIPSRNVMLATIGSMFGNIVWVNALDGEQNGKEHDKSPRFFRDTTKLLTFTNKFFQKRTIIQTPFSKMSKADTITWALLRGNIPKEVLFKTSTCYNPVEDKCGHCLTCYKRYVAFKLNNINEPGYKINPLESDYAKELDKLIPKAIEDNDTSRFTWKRMEEWKELKRGING